MIKTPTAQIERSGAKSLADTYRTLYARDEFAFRHRGPPPGHGLHPRLRPQNRHVALLLYRQPRFAQRPQHEFADALEDLRLGVNLIEMHSIAAEMPARAQEALAAMFAGLAAHFRALARGRAAPLGDEFLQKLDIAIGEVVAYTARTTASVAAVVGVRRTFYPDAPPYRPVAPPALSRAEPGRKHHGIGESAVIGEVDIYGVYLPLFVGFATVAFLLQLILKRVLNAYGSYRLVWHRPLVDLAIYVILLGVVTAAASIVAYV